MISQTGGLLMATIPEIPIRPKPNLMDEPAMIHPSAEVTADAVIGPRTRVWHHAQIREAARLGRECIIGKGVYIDVGVRLGDRVKVQNGASLYQGVEIEDGVFIGPSVICTNDKMPRAITPDGKLKSATDWTLGRTLIRYGASIGAGAIILPGVTIGRFAMVGAGAVVTRDVPDYGLVIGTPAKLRDFVCPCGSPLGITQGDLHETGLSLTISCLTCRQLIALNGFEKA
jgi:UDP-2-acetamido-3-amino-2,3-dideoxy-glucuronate N-acetyltransferase